MVLHLAVTSPKTAGAESATPEASNSPAATAAPVNWQFRGVPGGAYIFTTSEQGPALVARNPAHTSMLE